MTDRRFTFDQAENIRRLHGHLTISALATRYHVSYDCMRRLILRETYTKPHAPGAPAARCRCSRCQILAAADANIETARQATVTVHCVTCDGELQQTATVVVAHRGKLLCLHCSGRKADVP